jgi:hypothetical protein
MSPADRLARWWDALSVTGKAAVLDLAQAPEGRRVLAACDDASVRPAITDTPTWYHDGAEALRRMVVLSSGGDCPTAEDLIA